MRMNPSLMMHVDMMIWSSVKMNPSLMIHIDMMIWRCCLEKNLKIWSYDVCWRIFFYMMHVDMIWSIMCSRCCWRNMLKILSWYDLSSLFVYVCLCLWCFCLWNSIKAATSCGQHRPTVLHAGLGIRQGSSCPFHRERRGKWYERNFDQSSRIDENDFLTFWRSLFNRRSSHCAWGVTGFMGIWTTTSATRRSSREPVCWVSCCSSSVSRRRLSTRLS